MTSDTNKMTSDFRSKPKTQRYFESIETYVQSLGSVRKEEKAQVSYGVNRKFLWMWVYEKTADGTLYLTVCLDKELSSPHYHYVKQISKNRWNHHVEVKSKEIADSKWLHQLILAGYEFASA